MKPEFKNKDNKVYQSEDGPIWASRSTALVGLVIFYLNGEEYFLAEKRSKIMDSPGLWCLPCGYLDWDENGLDGIHREIYEETGLFLPDIDKAAISKDKTPFYVKTDPEENRQNVLLAYSSAYVLDSHPELQKMVLGAEKFKNEEIDEVKLIHVVDINKYQWAFDHEKIISDGFTHHFKDLIDFVYDDEDYLRKFEEIKIRYESRKKYDEYIKAPWWKQILWDFWA